MGKSINVMIYGANGYTGELIARAAVADRTSGGSGKPSPAGMKLVLAGRSAEKVAPLAESLGLSHRAFALDSIDLSDVDVVLHCAGPFSATAKPMIEACLSMGVHYLDITGEIAVFEYAQTMDIRAREAGVVICPGVGFDVIPTDCVAAALAHALPDASHLALGFDSRTLMSPGTTKTSAESLGLGGRIRRDGKLVTVPIGNLVRHIDFGAGEKMAATIPWGDVSTAYFTTGIPNIEVFIPSSPKRARSLRMANLMRPVMRMGLVQRIVQRRIERTVTGPSAESRAKTPVYVWGEVSNVAGEKRTARIKTANGYDLTITGALAVIEHLAEHKVEGGYYTPSRLCGADLVTRLPGSGPLVVE